ncbi:Protein RALF-like 24 [Capsicum baccatum]|nr:Protein RALF-like 24 [Capsicum baccatum]
MIPTTINDSSLVTTLLTQKFAIFRHPGISLSQPKIQKTKMTTPPAHKMQKILFFLIFIMIFCNGVSVFDLNSVKDCNFDVMGKRGCVEKVDQEDMMDSESNRRVLLMQKKYISYETLKRDLVPCNTPGASYYNCRAPGEANTYNRGCEIITRCARQVSDIKS